MIPQFGQRLSGIDYRQRRTVYGLAFGQDETIALVQLKNGWHWLPGGGVEPGESDQEALTREVREELARGIRINKFFAQANECFYAKDDRQHLENVATFYRIELTDALSSVAEFELAWVSLPHATETLFLKSHRWAVAEAFRETLTEGDSADSLFSQT